MPEKKKILVTGGAGFIGSNLIEQLVKDPQNKVYSLDNYSSGSTDNHIKGAEYINGYTQDFQALIKFKPDLIYHLGEFSRVEQSFIDPEKVLKNNFCGTLAVLDYWRKHPGVKLLYAGSSTKFGDNGSGKDQSPYAFSKATNTELVKNYGEWFKLPYAITYFYNVYGQREVSEGKYATLIAIFKEKVKRNEVLTVTSPGTQVRNFTHVNDIVKGLILVGEKGEGDGYGLGNKQSYSILEIAQMFGGKIEMTPSKPGNRMSASLETKKSEELGWSAEVSIKDHIEEFIKSLDK
jgi:UDP-glucose 4-epimerase